MRSPSSFGVGELLFSPTFKITPEDLSSWERAKVLGGRDDRPGFRPRLERPPVGGSVPEGLILSKTLEALGRSGNLGGCTVEQVSSKRLRMLGPVVLGEQLSAVATVRYRSTRPGDACSFLTLVVELRSESRKLGEVEVGVEVVGAPSPDDRPDAPIWRQAA